EQAAAESAAAQKAAAEKAAQAEKVAAAEKAAAQAPAGEPGSIFIASIPPVADVYMDGKMIGKTNIAELKVVSGKHTMKFVKGAKEVTREMTFQPGKNPSQMIRIQ
ncbi:MAG: PEGA domain-containing protein, partial [Spirochaetota bacterium]